MWFGVVLAVLALVFASVALIVRDGSGSSSSADVTSIELTEFALSPASVTVPAGGSLEVVNAGTAAHNLSIVDSGIVTTDLAAGDTETLDLSSLAPGEYEILCDDPRARRLGHDGHAHGDRGRRRRVVGSGRRGQRRRRRGTGHDHGGMMTEAEYAEMSEAMNATVGEFPAETEGVGNEVLEPVVAADGTKVFELTAAVTPWEVEPGKVVDAWTYNGMVPGPRMHVEVGDRVEIVLHNELPMATDVHVHGVTSTRPSCIGPSAARCARVIAISPSQTGSRSPKAHRDR